MDPMGPIPKWLGFFRSPLWFQVPNARGARMTRTRDVRSARMTPSMSRPRKCWDQWPTSIWCIFGVVTHWSWPLILTSMDTLSRDSSNLLPNPWTLVNWYPKSTHWTKEFFPLYQISGGGGTHSFGSPATGKLKLFDGISWCFLPARFVKSQFLGPKGFYIPIIPGDSAGDLFGMVKWPLTVI